MAESIYVLIACQATKEKLPYIDALILSIQKQTVRPGALCVSVCGADPAVAAEAVKRFQNSGLFDLVLANARSMSDFELIQKLWQTLSRPPLPPLQPFSSQQHQQHQAHEREEIKERGTGSSIGPPDPDESWVCFSSDIGYWDPSRIASFSAALRQTDKSSDAHDTRALFCTRKVLFARDSAFEHHPVISSDSGLNQHLGVQIHSAHPQSEDIGQYTQYLLRAKMLSSFLDRAPLLLIAHPYCEHAFTGFINHYKRQEDVCGRIVAFNGVGSCWMYGERELHFSTLSIFKNQLLCPSQDDRGAWLNQVVQKVTANARLLAAQVEVSRGLQLTEQNTHGLLAYLLHGLVLAMVQNAPASWRAFSHLVIKAFAQRVVDSCNLPPKCKSRETTAEGVYLLAQCVQHMLLLLVHDDLGLRALYGDDAKAEDKADSNAVTTSEDNSGDRDDDCDLVEVKLD